MIDVNAWLGHFAFRRLRNNTAAELLRLMDRKRIEKAVVASADAITYRNPQAGNEEIAAAVKPHRDRLIAQAVLNPAYAGWRDDLKICRDDFGMAGVRLLPRWHNYRLTDGPCLELAHAAAERKMPITIPQRIEDRRQQSWLVDVADVSLDEIAALVKAAPGASFILTNGLGYPGSALGRGAAPNYFIEICLLTAELANELAQLLSSLGEDRLLFGTGMPFHYPDPALAKLEVLDAPERVKEKIRRGNAARLLGTS